MFSTIWNRIKEMFHKLIGSKTIEQTLHIAPIISTPMADAIQLWGEMYKDESPWLREPDYGNPRRVESMNLAAQIASEKARMVVLEANITITAPTETVTTENPNYTPPAVDENGIIVNSDEPKTIVEDKPITPTERADFLDKQFDKVRKKIRAELEYGVAMGALIIKPYVVINKQYDENAEDVDVTEKASLEFDFIHADGFFPIAFDGSGNVTEAAFIQTKTDKNTVYTRLEYHKLEGNTVTVENRAFKTENISAVETNNLTSDLGQEISLTEVPEWKDLQPFSTINNVDRLLFAYFRMPEANTIDPHSPLGVSGFSRATKLIKQADLQYSRILWEYEAGEMAIDIDRDALMLEQDTDGRDITVLPHTQQRLYRKVDQEDLYQVFAPPLRDVSLFNGLNELLMRIEDVCSISRGTISEVNSEARTATELKILKQRSFSANQDIQKALEYALRDTIYIMDVYCTLYDMVGDSPINPQTGAVDTSKMGGYEASFEWDDSILVDVETELNKRLTLMHDGLVSDVENRMWYFGETEQQAIEALRKIKQEGQEDLESEMLAQSAFAKRKANLKGNNK